MQYYFLLSKFAFNQLFKRDWHWVSMFKNYPNLYCFLLVNAVRHWNWQFPLVLYRKSKITFIAQRESPVPSSDSTGCRSRTVEGARRMYNLPHRLELEDPRPLSWTSYTSTTLVWSSSFGSLCSFGVFCTGSPLLPCQARRKDLLLTFVLCNLFSSIQSDAPTPPRFAIWFNHNTLRGYFFNFFHLYYSSNFFHIILIFVSYIVEWPNPQILLEQNTFVIFCWKLLISMVNGRISIKIKGAKKNLPLGSMLEFGYDFAPCSLVAKRLLNLCLA